MAIRRVRLGSIPYEMPPGLYNPQRRWEPRQAVPVLIVEDDSGPAGVAQCRAPLGVVTALVEEVYAPLLAGEDPLAVHRLWELMYKASRAYEARGVAIRVLGALDVAVWDLRGQLLGQPIHRLLGGWTARVFPYASAGLYGTTKGVGDLGREMREYVDHGFRAVKMKIGAAPIDEDVARVRAVREAIGPQIQLIVDALNALTVDQAVRLAHAIEPFDVAYFESPTPVEHLDDLRLLKAGIGIPLLADELLSTRFAFTPLLVGRLVDVVQPNVTTVGGITEAVRVMSTASAFGVPGSFQSGGELELLAAVHVAGACPSVRMVEYHMLHRYLPSEIRDAVLPLSDGLLELPEAPGLGFPDRRALTRVIQEA